MGCVTCVRLCYLCLAGSSCVVCLCRDSPEHEEHLGDPLPLPSKPFPFDLPQAPNQDEEQDKQDEQVEQEEQVEQDEETEEQPPQEEDPFELSCQVKSWALLMLYRLFCRRQRGRQASLSSGESYCIVQRSCNKIYMYTKL